MKRRQSAAAIWCQRIAVFLIPYFLVVILGHRATIIDTNSLFWLLGLGILLIFATLALGIVGLSQLWQFGHVGGVRSARGIILALIISLPFFQYGWIAFELPPLNDVTTDQITPPVFQDITIRPAADTGNTGTLSPEQLEKQLIAYPQVGPRRYATSSDRIHSAVIKIMKRRGWRVVSKAIPESVDAIDVADSAKKHSEQTATAVPVPKPLISPNPEDSQNPLAIAGDDEELPQTIFVEAIVRSLVFGFESDVIVRIVEEDQLVLVDMRSTSRWGPHDFGSNAARIIGFMNELDGELAGIAGEG